MVMQQGERLSTLSAGKVLRAVLVESDELMTKVTQVFPVVTDEALLPYVAYRRAELAQTPTKSGGRGAERAIIEVNCYTAGYSDGVDLAELVREILDGAKRPEIGLRECQLTNASEWYEDDAFVQGLVFEVRI